MLKIMPQFQMCSLSSLICLLCWAPRLTLSGQFSAQLIHGNELPEFLPLDDEDILNYIDESSTEYDDAVQSNEISTNEAPVGETSYNPYEEGADYDEDPFLIPKSVLALAYDGSSPPKRTWLDEFDMDGYSEETTEQDHISYSSPLGGDAMENPTFAQTTPFYQVNTLDMALQTVGSSSPTYDELDSMSDFVMTPGSLEDESETGTIEFTAPYGSSEYGFDYSTAADTGTAYGLDESSEYGYDYSTAAVTGTGYGLDESSKYGFDYSTVAAIGMAFNQELDGVETLESNEYPTPPANDGKEFHQTDLTSGANFALARTKSIRSLTSAPSQQARDSDPTFVTTVQQYHRNTSSTSGPKVNLPTPPVQDETNWLGSFVLTAMPDYFQTVHSTTSSGATISRSSTGSVDAADRGSTSLGHKKYASLDNTAPVNDRQESTTSELPLDTNGRYAPADAIISQDASESAVTATVENTALEGSIDDLPSLFSEEEDQGFFFDEVTTSIPHNQQLNQVLEDSILVTSSKVVDSPTTEENELGTKSPTNISYDYQSDSWLGMSSLGEDETDYTLQAKSFIEEPYAKSSYVSEKETSLEPEERSYLLPGVFNRCHELPNPCSAGEDCQWIDGRVVCSPVNSSPQIPPCSHNPCKNGGFCRAEGGTFRCECPMGFSGFHCEVSSPCSPSPCHGSCKCVESCRHELGYFCQSDGGYTGKNCSIPLPKLSCEPSRMLVDLSPKLLEMFSRGGTLVQTSKPLIYVSPQALSSAGRSPQCRALQVGSDLKVAIRLPFDACGTRSYQPRDGSGGQIFRNRIWLDRRGPGFDIPVPIVDFQCQYQKQYSLVTSLKSVVDSPHVLSGSGRFSADVQLCKVSTCPGECPQQYVVNRGAVYTVGEQIHLSVSSKVAHLGFVLSVESLALSCDPTAESVSSVRLISNGCKHAAGIFVIANTGANACVSFQTPRVFSCSTVYLHINVNRCQSHQTRVCPSGQQTCARSRKRRSVALGQMFTVVGPVLLLNGSRGEGKLQVYPDANNHTPAAIDDSRYKLETTTEEKEPEIDKVPDVGPATYQLIALAVFAVSMFVLIVIAAKFAMCNSRRMLSLDDSV